jgi:SAM-dependent methyltransferase
MDMAHDVCPWWIGFFLASPLRKLVNNPLPILAPYVHDGMTVLEPGPGMGFFTLEMARLVGPGGRIVSVDIQPRMLESLRKRAGRKGVLDRLDLRLAHETDMGIGDLKGKVDFVLAFAVVHEMPDNKAFFRQASAALRTGGQLLFAEPANHIEKSEFATSIENAKGAGLVLECMLEIPSNTAALLTKR